MCGNDLYRHERSIAVNDQHEIATGQIAIDVRVRKC